MPLDEKSAFAQRLQSALKRSPKKVESSAQLAHEFNLRHPNEPITPQAAQKWLKGTAKPSGDKMETLAVWLNVSAHWLKNGPPPPPKKPAAVKRGAPLQPNQLSEKETRILTKLRALSEHQVFIVAELVDQLALEREIWGNEPSN